MQSVVCTLAEGNYFNGVAVLINSLYANNFKGVIVVGFRGELPKWINLLIKIPKEENELEYAYGFKLHNCISIYFIEINTNFHFTNYKPYFLLSVKEFFDNEKYDGIFFFDPDIVNICDWSFYQHWIKCGVALVHESVWNDMPPNHPKRKMWLKIAESMSLKEHHKIHSNINAGFVGVAFKQLSFVELWAKLINEAIVNFGMDIKKFSQQENDWGILKGADQDLFNLTAMLTEESISEFGPEGMGLNGGGWLMLHATGSPKPWNKNYLVEFIKGNKPSLVDKEFWNHADGVIKCFSPLNISYKIFIMKVVSFLSRFYSKS